MTVATRIHTKIRSTRRFAEILRVLSHNGFGAFVLASGLDGLVDKGRGIVDETPKHEKAGELPARVRLRTALEQLGPTFVKLGQILSTRSDLIPADLAHELRKLQDDAPLIGFDEVRARLETEFQGRVDELFQSIDETPLAAASMAQVHRAVLNDGTDVVIKVLRPGIEEIIESDMDLMRDVARFVEKHLASQAISPTAVVEEFSRQIARELDLGLEARSTARLRHLFEDDPNVSFPKVFRDHSTSRVLAIEAIEGRILADLEPQELSAEERRAIVTNGADAVFKMCLDFGFFHADPHPGNMFVLDESRLCFIDCGMTGHIDSRTADQLAQLIQAVVAGQADTVIRIAIDLAEADERLAFDRALRADVQEFIDQFQAAEGSLEELHLGEMLQGFFDLLRNWNVRCPSDLVFLIKALMTIEGVGQDFDPTFDLVAHVKPRLERKIMSRYGVKAMKERLTAALGGYTSLAEELPADLRTVLTRARKGDFAIRLEHKDLDRLSRTFDRASRTIAYGMVFASVILGSSILILADHGGEATGFLSKLGFAGLAGVALVALFLAAINLTKLGR